MNTYLNKSLLFIFILLFTSCKKDFTNEEVAISQFSFNITGIKDTEELGNRAATASESMPYVIQQEVKKIGEGMEAIVSIAEVTSNTIDPVIKNKNVAAKEEKQTPTSDTLVAKATFRVLVYNLDDTYVGQVNSAVGSPSSSRLKLYKNVTYKYRAYSHNDSEAIPAMINNTDIPLDYSRELIVCNGTFQVPEDSDLIKLDLEFQRKSSAIEVVIDARGMYGDIENIDLIEYNTSIKEGAVDVITYDAVENNSRRSTTSQPGSALKTYNYESYNNRVKSVTFFSLAKGNLPDRITVTLVRPTITGDRRSLDGFASDWGDDHYFKDRTLQLDVENLSALNLPLLPGKKYRIYATILMSGKEIGGNIWGRGNLYERKRTVKRFVPGPKGTSTLSGDPFLNHFMMRVHAGSNQYETIKHEISGEYFPKPTEGESDPCSQAFPQGYWKIPSKEDYEKLFTALDTINTHTRTSGRNSNAKIGTVIFGKKDTKDDRYQGSEYSSKSTNINSRNPFIASHGGLYMAKFLLNSNSVDFNSNNQYGPNKADDPYDGNENRLTFLYFGKINSANTTSDFNKAGHYWTSSSPRIALKLSIPKDGDAKAYSFVTMLDNEQANIKCVRNNKFSLKVLNVAEKDQVNHRPLDPQGK